MIYMKKHPSVKEIFVFYSKAIFVFLLTSLVIAFGIWYYDQTDDEVQTRDTVAIEGTASREVTPDIVEITVGAYLEGNDPIQLQNDANTAVNDATSRIIALGIEEENIRTSNYSLNNQYDFYNSNETEEYFIDVTFQITITNLPNRSDSNIVGDVLAEAAGANLNQVRGLYYDISNRNEILEELELEAIDDAKNRKNDIEDASDVQLGDVVDIVLGSGGGFYPYGRDDFATFDSAVPEAAPQVDTPIEVQPGQDELSVRVTVYYEVT